MTKRNKKTVGIIPFLVILGILLGGCAGESSTTRPVQSSATYPSVSSTQSAQLSPDPAQDPSEAPQLSGPSAIGNTVGNIFNGGNVVYQEGWLYYGNFSDNNKLYKISADGSGKTKLTDDQIGYLNAADGWIFYLNMSDYRVYRIRTDGTERTKLNDTDSSIVCIMDGWVYYGGFNGEVYKMKTDGSGATKIDMETTLKFCAADGWIYYRDHVINNICKVRTDGSEYTKLIDGSVFGDLYDVADGWIYYTRKDGLYKMQADGGSKTKLADSNATIIDNLNVYGDWIYFISISSSDRSKLYKMRTDGSEKTKLDDAFCHQINIANDLIYFYACKDAEDLDNLKFYSIHTDGGGKSPVD